MARKTRDLTFPVKGSPYLHYDFVIDGVRTCGTTKTADKKLAERIARSAWDAARDEAAERRKAGLRRDMRWKDAVASYLDAKGDFSTRERDERDLRWLDREIGENTYLSQIDHKLLATLVGRKRQLHVQGNPNIRKLSNATVNRTVTCIVRKILTHARLECAVHLPNEPNYRRLYLDHGPKVAEMMVDQEVKVMQTKRSDIWDAAKFIVLTGLRREAALLTWDQVNFPQGVMRVVTKNKQFQEIPITPDVRKLLLRAKGKHPTNVWTFTAQGTRIHNKTGQLYERGKHYPLTGPTLLASWQNVCRKAGVQKLTIHDLRKTHGARIVRETGDLLAASKSLGHASTHMTSTHYAHITGADVRRRLVATNVKTQERIERALRGEDEYDEDDGPEAA